MFFVVVSPLHTELDDHTLIIALTAAAAAVRVY
jgi:hypothetical protein